MAEPRSPRNPFPPDEAERIIAQRAEVDEHGRPLLTYQQLAERHGRPLSSISTLCLRAKAKATSARQDPRVERRAEAASELRRSVLRRPITRPPHADGEAPAPLGKAQ